MFLQVKDLRVLYEKVEALKGISLEVDAEEVITIIGPNGAGKSTILKAVSGLVKPSFGDIWFDGECISRITPQMIVARGISHVPEGRKVFRDLSVFENLKMGAYLRKDKLITNDVDSMYRYFPVLAERRRQRAGSLSGGEQQMLAIARGLMSKPKLLSLDEPSLGLSPLMTIEIAKIVTDINRRNKVSIILVEQNSRIALRLAKKAYVLETGNIVMSGATENLVENEHIKKTYLGE
jgi:branched-chain amino acid transport system ATP-binding protein